MEQERDEWVKNKLYIQFGPNKSADMITEVHKTSDTDCFGNQSIYYMPTLF